MWIGNRGARTVRCALETHKRISARGESLKSARAQSALVPVRLRRSEHRLDTPYRLAGFGRVCRGPALRGPMTHRYNVRRGYGALHRPTPGRGAPYETPRASLAYSHLAIAPGGSPCPPFPP